MRRQQRRTTISCLRISVDTTRSPGVPSRPPSVHKYEDPIPGINNPPPFVTYKNILPLCPGEDVVIAHSKTQHTALVLDLLQASRIISTLCRRHYPISAQPSASTKAIHQRMLRRHFHYNGSREMGMWSQAGFKWVPSSTDGVFALVKVSMFRCIRSMTAGLGQIPVLSRCGGGGGARMRALILII